MLVLSDINSILLSSQVGSLFVSEDLAVDDRIDSRYRHIFTDKVCFFSAVNILTDSKQATAGGGVSLLMASSQPRPVPFSHSSSHDDNDNDDNCDLSFTMEIVHAIEDLCFVRQRQEENRFVKDVFFTSSLLLAVKEGLAAITSDIDRIISNNSDSHNNSNSSMSSLDLLAADILSLSQASDSLQRVMEGICSTTLAHHNHNSISGSYNHNGSHSGGFVSVLNSLFISLNNSYSNNSNSRSSSSSPLLCWVFHDLDIDPHLSHCRHTCLYYDHLKLFLHNLLFFLPSSSSFYSTSDGMVVSLEMNLNEEEQGEEAKKPYENDTNDSDSSSWQGSIHLTIAVCNDDDDECYDDKHEDDDSSDNRRRRKRMAIKHYLSLLCCSLSSPPVTYSSREGLFSITETEKKAAAAGASDNSSEALVMQYTMKIPLTLFPSENDDRFHPFSSSERRSSRRCSLRSTGGRRRRSSRGNGLSRPVVIINSHSINYSMKSKTAVAADKTITEPTVAERRPSSSSSSSSMAGRLLKRVLSGFISTPSSLLSSPSSSFFFPSSSSGNVSRFPSNFRDDPYPTFNSDCSHNLDQEEFISGSQGGSSSSSMSTNSTAVLSLNHRSTKVMPIAN